ncbi:hypothetical protein BV908_14900 [Diaphorobacter sp. LR2014-1]|nr:hypothetical protein BV908_14900 [Diaphorobacter sp. LR2014-1]
MRPKWAGGPANRPDGPLQSLRRRVWAARVFALSVPDAFEKHFFNGLLGPVNTMEGDRIASQRRWMPGACAPQGSCLASAGNAADGPFARQPEGKLMTAPSVLRSLCVRAHALRHAP